MSIRTILSIFAFFLMLTLLPTAGWAAKTVWNFNVWGPKRAFTKGIEVTKEMMEAAMGDQFELRINYGDALGPRRQNLDSILIRAFEAATTCVGYHPNKLPLLSVMELPFLLPGDLIARARVEIAVLNHPDIKKEMASRWNVRFLAPGLLPPYEFMGNKRIANTADMKGVKMRISGLNALALKEFGAVPTMVTAPEGYQALDRGTIDSFGFPWTYAFGSYKLYEVSKYATVGMAMSGFMCLNVVSIDSYNALPDNMKRKMKDIQWAAVLQMKKAYEVADKKWLPIFKKRLEVIEFPASERAKLVATAGKIWAQWEREQNKKGRPGTQILSFVKAQVAKYAP